MDWREKVGRIVVLMLENRSFDHMLGYLREDGLEDVDGVNPEVHGNPMPGGGFQAVWPLGERAFDVKALDPGHGRRDVERQLRDGNQGFVENFVAAYERNREHHPPPEGYPFDPKLILGYQTAAEVPVYDWIARNHAVCDRWFASVPGPTWDNRLYATTGGMAEKASPQLPDAPGRFDEWLNEKLSKPPVYDRPAFTRELPDDAWRWYSHDPATLRLIDSRYRPGGERGSGRDDNFAYFDRPTLLEPRTFVDDARYGRLPEVSWIDPNFVDFRLMGPPGSNDDHPPSRVMLGQELVLRTLRAAMESDGWEQTMLVITYDEHGGFYDHVPPGEFEIPGDPDESYGVRVPALVVSPWIEPHVSHTVFDHTSLLKTILLRFAKEPEEAVRRMGSRTEHANHLGELLTADAPRDEVPRGALRELERKVTAWKERAYERELLEEPELGERVYGTLTDIQADIVGVARYLRRGRDDERISPGKP